MSAPLLPGLDAPATCTPAHPVRGTASFSPCGRYRFELGRTWGESPPLVVCALNPSRASAEISDPTVTRLMTRARRLGCGGLVVVNLFALRSTDPRELKRALDRGEDPIGPENDAAIVDAARLAGRVLCAWGTHGALLGRGAKVAGMLVDAGFELVALGVNADSSPVHPLYQPYEAPLVPYSPPRMEAR